MKNFLSKLPEDIQEEIKAEFDKAVNEEVELRISAILEAHVNKIVEDSKATVAKTIDQITEAATETLAEETLSEVESLNMKVGKYIDAMIAESLPEQLVERVAKGLQYEKYLDKLHEALVEDAEEDASHAVSEEIEELKEQLKIAQDKYVALFEKVVDDGVKIDVANKQSIAEELISNLPDRDARVVGKIFFESVDLENTTEKQIESKIKKIYETVRNTNTAATQQLNEGGKGVSGPMLSEDIDVLDSDVAESLLYVKRFAGSN